MKPVAPDPKTLFEDLDTSSPLIVAVSGGSDSIALLLLAAAWSRHRNGELIAVTIDHGLRPEAAAEAAFVASVCEGLDVPHVTLAWSGIKPLSGLQNAARMARYDLLVRYARDAGCCQILTAHTADDQAETVWMRLQRETDEGSGRGLAGMAKETRLEEKICLQRPLIQVRRSSLRAYLRDHQQAWIEDPSNSDESYELVRVRKFLEDRPWLVRDVLQFSTLMARMREHLAGQAANFLSQNLNVSDGPVFQLNWESFVILPGPVRHLVLQTVIALAGGGEHLVSLRAVKEFERAHIGGASKRTTLGNAILEVVFGKLRVFREFRNVPAVVIGSGEHLIWDGRLAIHNDGKSSVFCGPISKEQILEYERDIGKKLNAEPRAALHATPFIRGNGDEILLPFVSGAQPVEGLKLALTARAFARFCPQFDYALLDWIETFSRQSGFAGQESGGGSANRQ